jgi:uncharacterized glyoxalase superfamily protein PhnB
MKPTPKGWPRISASLNYREARQAIDWLCQAFGFEVQMLVEGPDGAVHHSQLTYGDGLIMVAEEAPRSAHPERHWRKSPLSVGGANTAALMLYVDDVDAHCARARAAGAKITMEPANTDYGPDYWEDRGYEAADPDGHHWWFIQRIRDPK